MSKPQTARWHYDRGEYWVMWDDDTELNWIRPWIWFQKWGDDARYNLVQRAVMK